jgi:hypothetical protein
MLRFAAQLLVTDHRQHRAQPLVVSNRSLLDLLDFVEGSNWAITMLGQPLVY